MSRIDAWIVASIATLSVILCACASEWNDAHAADGIVGCMATSCHGSRDTNLPVWQQSGRLWFDQDPHAQAYTVLWNERSRSIIAGLSGSQQLDEDSYRVLLETKCVSCHATDTSPIAERALGIRCESCHGALSEWGEDHYSEATRNRGTQRFEGTRRVPLPNLEVRAKVCASCHIGDRQRRGEVRDVDHAMMAAGHPPMPYDFSNYLARYPSHWRTKASQSQSESPWEHWRTGKIQSLLMRLQLLEDRIEDQVVWPELTEFSCSSCHHELQGEGWRSLIQSRPQARWDDWHSAYMEVALPTTDVEISEKVVSELASIRVWMESTSPDQKQIVERSRSVRHRLAAGIEAARDPSGVTVPTPEQSLHILMRDGSEPQTWEQGVQWMLAVRAASQSTDLKAPKLEIPSKSLDGFFDEPHVWSRGRNASLDSTEWFQPPLLMQYRDAWRQILRGNP